MSDLRPCKSILYQQQRKGKLLCQLQGVRLPALGRTCALALLTEESLCYTLELPLHLEEGHCWGLGDFRSLAKLIPLGTFLWSGTLHATCSPRKEEVVGVLYAVSAMKGSSQNLC